MSAWLGLIAHSEKINNGQRDFADGLCVAIEVALDFVGKPVGSIIARLHPIIFPLDIMILEPMAWKCGIFSAVAAQGPGFIRNVLNDYKGSICASSITTPCSELCYIVPAPAQHRLTAAQDSSFIRNVHNDYTGSIRAASITTAPIKINSRPSLKVILMDVNIAKASDLYLFYSLKAGITPKPQ
ncbi:hypothetical protein NDU88_003133 [Pleurodeles waltl]|uniref:Uncharacterized protein n=1 Tax=Pleurodeles waltl TaxID=8319 RepID=A0AAV7Q8T8_PLEWA|nr:hypothetical protein NDU88_003133 [Pleurodeles waltl]